MVGGDGGGGGWGLKLGKVHKARHMPRNLHFKVHKVLHRFKVHKALHLPRNLHLKVHFKVQKARHLPRNLHFKVHKVLRLPQNLPQSTAPATKCALQALSAPALKIFKERDVKTKLGQVFSQVLKFRQASRKC